MDCSSKIVIKNFTITCFFIFICIALACELRIASAQIPPGWLMKEELIGYMESPKDTIYIQDRKKLQRVRGRRCISHGVRFIDPTLSLSIQISEKRFDPLHHIIHYPGKDSLSDWDGMVDGKPSYGIDVYDHTVQGVGGLREISQMKIIWNGEKLKIPKSAIQNLYEAWLCSSHAPSVEAYVTNDNRLLYIYVSGSDAGESYAVKFIFDRKGFVTRIINRNECSDVYDFLDANDSCD